MIKAIKSNTRLTPYLKTKIEDSGIVVNIAPDLSENDYVAIKVDDYYSGLKIATPPKAVDYVVIVDCKCDWFAIYILELKNVTSPTYIDIKDVQEKFDNTINKFLSDTFSDIFLSDRFKYKAIKLYLVSDAYKEIGKFSCHREYLSFREKINRRDSLKVDVSLTSKLYRFRGKIVRIEYDIPPNPIITRFWGTYFYISKKE